MLMDLQMGWRFTRGEHSLEIQVTPLSERVGDWGYAKCPSSKVVRERIRSQDRRLFNKSFAKTFCSSDVHLVCRVGFEECDLKLSLINFE